MPILEKQGILIRDYIKENLPYTVWSLDKFLRMCRNSFEKKEDYVTIDGTTQFTIPLSSLHEYFASTLAPTPEAMDVAPIEAKPIAKPKPRPKKEKGKKK